MLDARVIIRFATTKRGDVYVEHEIESTFPANSTLLQRVAKMVVRSASSFPELEHFLTESGLPPLMQEYVLSWVRPEKQNAPEEPPLKTAFEEFEQSQIWMRLFRYRTRHIRR